MVLLYLVLFFALVAEELYAFQLETSGGYETKEVSANLKGSVVFWCLL